MVQNILSKYFSTRGYKSVKELSFSPNPTEEKTGTSMIPEEAKEHGIESEQNLHIVDSVLVSKKKNKKPVFTKKELVILNQRLQHHKMRNSAHAAKRLTGWSR
jgi:hypothetical protein